MSEFKYLIFFLALFFGVPAAFALSLRFRPLEKLIFCCSIFLTAIAVHINFVSMEFYRGTSRGFEICLVDLFILVLFLLIIARRWRDKIIWFPPGSVLFGLYFLFSVLSVMNSGDVLYSLFELFKMLRMWFYFWTMANYIKGREQFNLTLISFALITFFVFALVLYDKYFMGVFQARGPFPHQNSMAMYMTVIACVLFSRVMNRSDILILPVFPVAGMAALSVLFTYSRAGMLCMGLGMLIVMGLSYTAGLSWKKVLVTFFVSAAALFVLIRAYDRIVERFTTAPAESAEVRVVLAEAAVNMANDKFFGVGLNNFGLKINPPYRYGDHIPRESDEEEGGLVETIYLMIAAETGWVNLAVFISLLGFFYVKNLRIFFALRGGVFIYMSAGLAGGLASIYAESTLEWVLKQTNNFYELMLVFALICALGRVAAEKKLDKPPADTAWSGDSPAS
jgi:hypothetical protein